MKEAIIFEKGLNGKKFDKKQIKQAQKIVEKFKKDNKAPTKKGKQLNDAQQAEQKQQKLFTFTIDASGTKSRDDALSIQQVQQGVYSVGVHISDVAYHVKRHSYLDQQARNRDGTLYVKNYYFPMLPDILTKDFLSLKANQQRMTYSLFFQMSKQGLINMSQCQIRQTISKVDRNLTHKQADQIIKSYQQKKSKDKDLITAKNLAMLNEIMKNRKLIDQNECLQTGFQSQKIVSQAMSISSCLVGFILENNIQRISDYKQKVTQHVQMQVKDNIDHLDSIQKDVSTLQSVRRKVKDVQNKLAKAKRQINKKVEQETRRIKRQYKAIKNQEKQQVKKKRSEQKRQVMGRLGRNSLRGNQSQSQTSLSQQSDSQLQKQDKKTVFEDFEQTKQIEQNFEDILKEAVQQKVRQQKQPKKAKQKKEESSEPESQDSVIDQQTQNRLKRQAAEGGKKYLERVFKHFEIELRWSSSKEIEGAFQKILKMNKTKSKLYQQYFERMQIMNRQHYKYIVINQRKNQQKKQSLTQINDTRKTNNERKKQGKFDKQNKEDKKEVFQKQQSIKQQLDTKVQTSQKHSNKSKRSENYKSQKLNEKVSKNNKGNFTQKLKQKNQPNYAKDQVQLMLRKYILPIVKKFQNKQMAQKILNQVKKNAEKQKSIIPLQASQIGKSTINIPSKFLPKMMPGFVSKPEQSIKLKQQQGSHTQLALGHVTRQVNKISQVKVNEPSQIKHNLNDQIQTKQLAQKNEQKLTIKKTKIVDQMDRLLSKYLIDNKNQLVQEKKKKKREEQKSLKKKQKQAIEALRKQIIQSFKQELDAHRRDIQTFDDSVREIKQKLGKFVDSWRILKKIIQTLKSKQDYSKVEKNFIKIIENISSKIGYKQKKNQLKDVKQKLLEIHPLKTFKKQDMRKDNQRFFQFCSNESNKLKWNNPIRSYSSLETLRIIKEFQWIFQGELHPLDVLQFADQIKVINKQVKHIKKQRKDREQAGQNDRNVKEANREIAKWEFYESIKNKLDGQHTFLNVLPPPTTAKVVKKVYHPILGELDVANTAIEQKPFEQIKGKVKIECHFPLDFSVNLVSQ